MGEARRRRDAGERMGNTDDERESFRHDELWRMERQRNGLALNERRRIAQIPRRAIPRKKVVS